MYALIFSISSIILKFHYYTCLVFVSRNYRKGGTIQKYDGLDFKLQEYARVVSTENLYFEVNSLCVQS